MCGRHTAIARHARSTWPDTSKRTISQDGKNTKLTRQGRDTDDEEEDEAPVVTRDDESRAAGSGLSSPKPSVEEDLFGSEFFSEEEDQRTPSPQGHRDVSDDGDTEPRSPSDDDVPADEFGFPQASLVVHKLKQVMLQKFSHHQESRPRLESSD